MTVTLAKLIVQERLPDYSRQEIADAWQFLIDNGIVWSMGKWYVQMAECLIASGSAERNAA